jgi:hypothetical protein
VLTPSTSGLACPWAESTSAVGEYAQEEKEERKPWTPVRIIMGCDDVGLEDMTGLL